MLRIMFHLPLWMVLNVVLVVRTVQYFVFDPIVIIHRL